MPATPVGYSKGLIPVAKGLNFIQLSQKKISSITCFIAKLPTQFLTLIDKADSKKIFKTTFYLFRYQNRNTKNMLERTRRRHLFQL